MAFKFLLYIPLLAPFAHAAPLEDRDAGYPGTTNWQCAHYEWGARWVPIENPVGDHLTFKDAAMYLCGDLMDMTKSARPPAKFEYSTATSRYVENLGGTKKKVGFSDGTEGHLTLTWERTAAGWPEDPHEYCYRNVMLLADWDKDPARVGDSWGSSCWGAEHRDTIGGSFNTQDDFFNATAVVA